jgi:hypothetical protein
VDTFSSAVRTLYEPIGIRRRAGAEASAAITHAKAERDIKVIEAERDQQIQLMRIESRDVVADAKERSKERVRLREERRQQNLDDITTQAAIQAPPTVSDEPVDEDWIAAFINDCQDISNGQMQLVWGRILAGEVSKPRSFSLRTLAAVRTMSQADANTFTQFCSVVWEIQDALVATSLPEPALHPLILHPSFLNPLSLNLPELAKLDAMGLVLFESSPRYHMSRQGLPIGPQTRQPLWKIKGRYHGRNFVFSKPFPPPMPIPPGQWSGLSFETGNILLTDIGAELYPISGSTEHRGYLALTLAEIQRRGWLVEEQAAQEEP